MIAQIKLKQGHEVGGRSLDAKDRQIIEVLQREGRLPNLELAERVNLSPSPCLRRLRALEACGVIAGYAAIVDQEAYGLPITAWVRVRLNRHDRDEVAAFERHVRGLEEVLECFLLTGDADYLLRAIVADLKAYEAFVRERLHTIPGIAAIDTSFVYGTIKTTHVFPRLVRAL